MCRGAACRAFGLPMCRGAACCASSNWAYVGAPLAAPSLGRASPAPAVLFVMPDSEMCIPELSEIASVTSFPRNGPTFSVCNGASSPGAQSNLPSLHCGGEGAGEGGRQALRCFARLRARRQNSRQCRSNLLG
ncbi:MAG: hypothetical protein HW376_1715 [candidate division NC10 bacterium]|nr:hypothetical protein [candidate division NC10 bacterium]